MTLTRRNILTQGARAVGIVALSLPLAGIASFEALFAPKAELWPRWQAHDPAATATIDHTAWDNLLSVYLRADGSGLNRFDYGGVSPTDRAALDTYIQGLADVPIDDFTRDEQFAYWVNLYNALTVQVVLDAYPVESIRDIDISPGLFADGPWDKELVTIEGEAISLNDIEHRILRPIWRDPRIHYAVNCASVGCPNLQPMAFTGGNVERLLDDGARAYINSPRGLRQGNRGFVVSSIYAWFEEDFGDGDADIITHLERYADPETLEKLQAADKITGHDYDWSLNDTQGSAAQTGS